MRADGRQAAPPHDVLAWLAGADILDPEFVQFHPTAIDVGLDPMPLATEALRGEGARLIDGAQRGEILQGGKPLDPVARFHLGNGARVERLNWAADPSAKGIKQSHGLMVNYLYDLKRLDKHRALLAQGKIPIAAAIKDLYL